MNSGTPTSASSCWMLRLSADGLTWLASLALPKCSAVGEIQELTQQPLSMPESIP
jgi:hypothetical protein